ncbi:zinc finger, CCHC-type containing protein [Tanacetum coccineum]
MTKGETSTPTREQNIALQCLKLNESNYTTWAIMMETLLKAYGLWETLEATEVTDEKKMNTIKAMILTTLPEDILMQVAQYSKAKEVWESIKVRYIGEERVQKARLQTLRSELETLKMKNNETVSDFAGKLERQEERQRARSTSHLRRHSVCDYGGEYWAKTQSG